MATQPSPLLQECWPERELEKREGQGRLSVPSELGKPSACLLRERSYPGGRGRKGNEEGTGREWLPKKRKEIPKYGCTFVGDKSGPVLDSGASKQLPTLL